MPGGFTFNGLLDRLSGADSNLLLAGQQKIINLLNSLPQEIQTMLDQKTLDIIKRIDDAANSIGTRIQALSSQIGTGMTAQDVTDLQTQLSAEADKLTALGTSETSVSPAP